MSTRAVHLTTFFLGKLEETVYQYFVHIPLLVTDNDSFDQRKVENDRKICFMINLDENIAQDWDRTRDPWI